MLWEGTDNQSTRTNKQTELTVFAGGDTASRLLHMNSSDRENFYVNQLDNFYEGRFSAQKKELKFMSWPTEPWTMAGYSFPAVGEVCTKIRALNTVYNHRMVFAGEHTCLAFVGYMEGALQSGLQAAIKVNRMSLKESI